MPIHTISRARLNVESEVLFKQCNVCGKPGPEKFLPATKGTDRVNKNQTIVDNYDTHIIELSGGWGDQFPADLETITFVVCSSCLETWTKTFKIPPEFTHRIGKPCIHATHSETGKHLVSVYNWIWEATEEDIQGASDRYNVATFKPTAEDIEWMNEGRFELEYERDDSGSGVVPNGIYQHYEGDLYEVFDYAFDTKTREAFVIYRELYGESKVWARPTKMWFELVRHPSGFLVPRFKLLNYLISTKD